MQHRVIVSNYGDKNSLEYLGVEINEESELFLNGNHSVDSIMNKHILASGIIETCNGNRDYEYLFQVGETFKINGCEYTLSDVFFPHVYLSGDAGCGPFSFLSLIAAKIKEDMF